MDRARLALETEVPSAETLDVPFYLANVYSNVARLTDMRRVSANATRHVENGDWPEPTDGIGRFRLGKLYADQQRTDESQPAVIEEQRQLIAALTSRLAKVERTLAAALTGTS